MLGQNSTTNTAYRGKHLIGFRRLESVMTEQRPGSGNNWRVTSWSVSRRHTGNDMSLWNLEAILDIPPKSSQTVPTTGDQVFKPMSLQGPFSFTRPRKTPSLNLEPLGLGKTMARVRGTRQSEGWCMQKPCLLTDWSTQRTPTLSNNSCKERNCPKI